MVFVCPSRNISRTAERIFMKFDIRENCEKISSLVNFRLAGTILISLHKDTRTRFSDCIHTWITATGACSVSITPDLGLLLRYCESYKKFLGVQICIPERQRHVRYARLAFDKFFINIHLKISGY
jgi:hypothetical protein